MLDTQVKLHDVPVSLQATLDAIYAILNDNPIAPDDITEIVLGFNRYSLRHVGSIGPEPRDMVSAQFNAYFSAALAVVKGSNDLNTYVDAMHKNFSEPAVLAVSRRVRLVWDEACEAAFPEAFLGKVSIVTTDGRSYRAVKHPKGSPQNPLATNDVRDKFMRLVAPVLSEARAETILSRVEALEQLDDIRHLTSLLVVDQ
jgi:2-methylcitrate dehydratase PrpD